MASCAQGDAQVKHTRQASYGNKAFNRVLMQGFKTSFDSLRDMDKIIYI